MAENMMELSELDQERYSNKMDGRGPRTMVLSKAHRIAAIIQDLQQAEQQFFSRRKGNPKMDETLKELSGALKEVKAEIEKLQQQKTI